MLKHIIGIVLGIIGIVILFGLSAKLYGFFSGDDKKEEAISTLESMVEILEKIRDKENISYYLSDPKSWILISYTKASVGLPNQCTGNNCLCICPSKKLLSGVDCDEGICQIIEKEARIEEEIEIPSNVILKSNGFYEIIKKEEKN